MEKSECKLDQDIHNHYLRLWQELFAIIDHDRGGTISEREFCEYYVWSKGTPLLSVSTNNRLDVWPQALRKDVVNLLDLPVQIRGVLRPSFWKVQCIFCGRFGC